MVRGKWGLKGEEKPLASLWGKERPVDFRAVLGRLLGPVGPPSRASRAPTPLPTCPFSACAAWNLRPLRDSFGPGKCKWWPVPHARVRAPTDHTPAFVSRLSSFRFQPRAWCPRMGFGVLWGCRTPGERLEKTLLRRSKRPYLPISQNCPVHLGPRKGKINLSLWPFSVTYFTNP